MQGRIKLFVFFGLIASGKSTLAEKWAQKTGAGYYNSDRVRKGLAGLDSTSPQQESFNAGIYTPEFSRRTYDRMLALAEAGLSAGKPVVLDGSYHSQQERTLVKELGQKLGVRLLFVLCHCSETTTRKRLAIRAQDQEAVSDGRWEIYLKQKKGFSTPSELADDEIIHLNTEATVDELIGRMEREEARKVKDFNRKK